MIAIAFSSTLNLLIVSLWLTAQMELPGTKLLADAWQRVKIANQILNKRALKVNGTVSFACAYLDAILFWFATNRRCSMRNCVAAGALKLEQRVILSNTGMREVAIVSV